MIPDKILRLQANVEFKTNKLTKLGLGAFVDIARAGKITGRNKALDKGRQVFAFAAGTKKLYDYVDCNPDVMGPPYVFAKRKQLSHNPALPPDLSC